MVAAGNGFLHVAFSQLWQVTVLAFGIYVIVRLFARHRPHLAYVLWLVVLIKSVTPPLWKSSFGMFCWASQSVSESVLGKNDPRQLPRIENGRGLPWDGNSAANAPANFHHPQTVGHSEELTSAKAIIHLMPSDPSWFGDSFELRQAMQVVWLWVQRVGLGLWISGSVTALLLAAIGWAKYWRQVSGSRQENPPHAEEYLRRLAIRLGVRRRVRLLVTSSSFGPATVGCLRPTIILPQLLVQQKSLAEIEPILSHELIHIRRLDFCWGVVQLISQSLWWFHPLLWLASRRASAEAERCCDEEVLGNLDYTPKHYATCLLQILELKLALRQVPILPGLRAVEVTSERLERIMKLRHGCHKRTPWWCWCTMIIAASVTIPGAALTVEEIAKPLTGEATDSLAKDESKLIKPGDKTVQPAPIVPEVNGPVQTHVVKSPAHFADVSKGDGTSSDETMLLSLQDAIQTGLIRSPILRDAKIYVTATYTEPGKGPAIHLAAEEAGKLEDAVGTTSVALHDIQTAYWDLWLAQRVLSASSEARDEAQQLWKDVFEASGLSPQQLASEQQAREQYFFFRARIESDVKDVQRREGELRNLLGLAEVPNKRLVPSEPEPPLDAPVTSVNVLEWTDAIVEKNPEISIQRRKKEKLESEVHSMKWARGISPERDSRDRINQLELARAKARLEDMILNAQHSLSSRIRNCEMYVRLAQTHGIRCQTAHEEMRHSRELLQSEKLTMDLALDAQRRWLQSKLDYDRSLADFMKSKHDVDYCAGRTLETSRVFISSAKSVGR